MPTVVVPSLWQDLTSGKDKVSVAGNTIRKVIDNLEKKYPGIKDRICDEGRIRVNIAIWVDGAISREGMIKTVHSKSIINFTPAISGGCL